MCREPKASNCSADHLPTLPCRRAVMVRHYKRQQRFWMPLLWVGTDQSATRALSGHFKDF